MKKVFTVLLTGLLATSLIGCSSDTANKDSDNKDENSDEVIGGDPNTWGPDLQEDDNVEIPNPIVYVDTIDEAIQKAGFEITVPDTISGYEMSSISVYELEEGNMIQVIYEDGDNEISLRKQKMTGENPTDISGVYISYDSYEEMSVGDVVVSMNGEGENVFVATWIDGTYDYSMYASSGISSGVVYEIVSVMLS